jgi:DNA invertase Pin-like site-specific DNA recombinase
VLRPGFQKLVASVCTGAVGAVFCIVASRLARNGRDWHHLVDLCAVVGVLVIDPDGVYDPRLVNDRLLLGLKGTMSERVKSVATARARRERRVCGLMSIAVSSFRYQARRSDQRL